MKWYVRIGNTLLILFSILFCLFIIPNSAWSSHGVEDRARTSESWTPMQKLWRGITEEKKMVVCRLAKKKVVRDQKICLYMGANNTTETVFIDKFEFCPRQIQCVYEPEKDKPNILEMMESLEESLK